jgi:hypothetical protein
MRSLFGPVPATVSSALAASPVVAPPPFGIPDAGTSLATLLSFANAVVTRRRAQVSTLPLGVRAVQVPPGRLPPAPGSYSS